jgi:hypothetical protein
MSGVASELAKRLAAAGVGSSALAQAVVDMAMANAESINREGIRSQIEFLLSAWGPGEIEKLARLPPSGIQNGAI